MSDALTALFSRTFEWREDLSIVRVGANDGVSGDHFWPVIKEHPEWRVLYIEPHPKAFERLLKNIPGCTAVNVAISDKNEVRTMWEVRLPSDNPDFHHDMLTSFDKSVVMQAGSGYDPYEFEVRCAPLATVLGGFKPDVYLIDTEGYDLEVMKQIDTRPEMVVWEHWFLNDEEKLVAQNMWRDRGYALHVFFYDTAAVKD